MKFVYVFSKQCIDQVCSDLDLLSPLTVFHRSDGSWWSGTVCLSVSVPYSEWTEVACCRAYCLLCPEHATGPDPLTQHWGASKTVTPDRFRPTSHCQSKSPLRCVM